MTKCLFCSGEHTHTECPMFAKTEVYIETFAPRADIPPPQSAKRSSLAITTLEEFYGEDAIDILNLIAGDADYDSSDHLLAEQIISGGKTLEGLDHIEREQLHEMTMQFLMGPSGRVKEKPKKDPVIRRPAYVATREEMEDFSGPTVEENLPEDPFAYLKNINDVYD